MVARVYGIPVRIDYRWFLIFALSVALIAANVRKHPMQLFAYRVEPTGDLLAWTLGVITTLGLFVSVFGHELSHALMGRTEGIEIEEIVLHPFGGLARLRSQPQSPGAEFRIAVAGPAASFIFSVLSFLGMWVVGTAKFEFGISFFFFLGAGNLLLAVFNLFPGYPLDGGRVLRAIIWQRSGSIRDATRIAGFCGQLMALVLVIFGFYMAFAPSFRAYFMGLWSALVGLFLLGAATSVVKSASSNEPMTAAEGMAPAIEVNPGLSVAQFVDDILPLHRYTTFPVVEAGRFVGILSLEDLKKVPRENWRAQQIRSVMHAANPLLFVTRSTSMAKANELMLRNQVGALAVVDESNRLIGFLRHRK